MNKIILTDIFLILKYLSVNTVLPRKERHAGISEGIE